MGEGMSDIPAGYAPVPDMEARSWREARMLMELGQARVQAAEARIREYSNGLEAASLQKDKEGEALAAATSALVAFEASLGAEKPSDLIFQGGKLFRRINGKAKATAIAQEETRRLGHQPASRKGLKVAGRMRCPARAVVSIADGVPTIVDEAVRCSGFGLVYHGTGPDGETLNVDCPECSKAGGPLVTVAADIWSPFLEKVEA